MQFLARINPFFRVIGRLVGLWNSGRLFIFLALLVLAGVGFVLAEGLESEYWSSLFLELAAAVGLFAALFFFAGEKLDRVESLVLAVAAILILGVAYRSGGFLQSALIEVGAGAALVLGLEVYLSRRLLPVFEREAREAELTAFASSLLWTVYSRPLEEGEVEIPPHHVSHTPPPQNGGPLRPRLERPELPAMEPSAQLPSGPLRLSWNWGHPVPAEGSEQWRELTEHTRFIAETAVQAYLDRMAKAPRRTPQP